MKKQQEICKVFIKASSFTLAEAVNEIGKDIYLNAPKHVGAILSRMVNNGSLIRIRKGLFKVHPYYSQIFK
jgi:hypothetical protein